MAKKKKGLIGFIPCSKILRVSIRQDPGLKLSYSYYTDIKGEDEYYHNN